MLKGKVVSQNTNSLPFQSATPSTIATVVATGSSPSSETVTTSRLGTTPTTLVCNSTRSPPGLMVVSCTDLSRHGLTPFVALKEENWPLMIILLISLISILRLMSSWVYLMLIHHLQLTSHSSLSTAFGVSTCIFC